MSRALLSPNYCSCTVNRARNLPDKGKAGGIDAFCTISLGKEKFVTAVVEKTTAPDWHEQCDMPIVNGDTLIKLTIYHNSKSSLSKGDFIGRTMVSLRDLPDYDRVHTNWYKLANKEGKLDKNRGEIEISLQFYSKNDTTGSVLDLATKKKHVSLKDIKHSLSNKLKLATKHGRGDQYGGDNKLADQQRRLGGNDGSSYLGPDFLDDARSDSTSITGSHISVNSMSQNTNVDQRKKKSRAPSAETPRSSRRSVTSDYETSSILDSASMYGGDEHSTSSTSVQNPIPQPREVNVDEPKPLKTKKAKEPVPIINVTKPIETSEDHSNADSIFGLSTIRENHDSDDNLKHVTDDELDFDNYFDKFKQPPAEQKKTKKPAPVLSPPLREARISVASRADEIRTPSTSISLQSNPILSHTSTEKTHHDSTDDDVDELLGNLERMSSMRSSVKRKIRPREDVMEQPFTEPTGGFNQTPTNRKSSTTLPDVVDQRGINPGPRPPKPPAKGLTVLGYENVKNTPVNARVRQELEYIDREDLLHIIAHQSDIIKKRDTRLKDLEQYTDGLLVKIVEQCPTILQSDDTLKFNTNKDF